MSPVRQYAPPAGVMPGYSQPPAAVYGELSGDGRRIILLPAGDDHELRQIAGQIELLTPQWQRIPESGGEAVSVPATWPAVVQLGHTFTGRGGSAQWCPQPALSDWMTQQWVRRMAPPPLPEGAVPPGERLRDYQAADAAVIAHMGKVLLLHDTGTGKTPIAITGLEGRRLTGHEIFPMIIIVPGWDVADVWDSHIRTWAPHWPAPVLHKGANRARVQGWKHGRYILLTTYATARLDARHARDLLPGLAPAAVIADEAHLIGNAGSQQSQAVMRIARHAGCYIAASGTLVTHSMKNVHPPLKGMDHDSWPSYERTKPRYISSRPGDGGYGEKILGLRPEMAEEFFACLEGQLLRRAKRDVLDQLPPVIYSVRRPELPAEWRHAYDGMERQMLAELPDGGDLPVMSILAQLTRLSQLASSAADVKVTTVIDEQTGREKPHYEVTLKRPCWKAETFLGIMAERPDMPTACFAESRQLAMLTGEYCAEAGLRCGYVTGPGPRTDGGPPVTRRTRQQAVADFQAGKLDVIICTAGAGGTGITLTAANCAVMLQRSWQLDLALQPDGRIDRIGAEVHDHLEIVDVVAQHTIDQRRRDVLRDKAGQLGQLVRDARVVRELLGGLR
jgi:SNF2 family DNA or RNA helicase